jgi:hypothetical protein
VLSSFCLFSTVCSLFCCLPSKIYCLHSAVCCLLSAVYCLLSAFYFLLRAACAKVSPRFLLQTVLLVFNESWPTQVLSFQMHPRF